MLFRRPSTGLLSLRFPMSQSTPARARQALFASIERFQGGVWPDVASFECCENTHAGEGFGSRTCLAPCPSYESPILFALSELKSAFEGGRGELIFLPLLRLPQPRVCAPGFRSFLFLGPGPASEGPVPLGTGLPKSDKILPNDDFWDCFVRGRADASPRLASLHLERPAD